jgi:hypothetical protein
LNLAIFASWKRDFAAGVYLSEAPLTHCIVYTYFILIHTGKGVRGGRVEPERRLEGQQFTKLGKKIPTYSGRTKYSACVSKLSKLWGDYLCPQKTQKAAVFLFVRSSAGE